MNNNTTFVSLKVGDIFQTETKDYYIKINPTNGFNSIILTGKEVDYCFFDDDIKIEKTNIIEK